MPAIPKKKKDIDALIESAMAEREEFMDLTQWRRSAKGNLWRKWWDCTVTIFCRDDLYRWAIASDIEATRFSREAYDDEEEAMTALGGEMGVGIP